MIKLPNYTAGDVNLREVWECQPEDTSKNWQHHASQETPCQQEAVATRSSFISDSLGTTHNSLFAGPTFCGPSSPQIERLKMVKQYPLEFQHQISIRWLLSVLILLIQHWNLKMYPIGKCLYRASIWVTDWRIALSLIEIVWNRCWASPVKVSKWFQFDPFNYKTKPQTAKALMSQKVV